MPTFSGREHCNKDGRRFRVHPVPENDNACRTAARAVGHGNGIARADRVVAQPSTHGGGTSPCTLCETDLRSPLGIAVARNPLGR